MEKQTTIRLIPFHPKHVEVMDVRDLEVMGILTLEDMDERFERLSETCVEVGTFMHDGRVLCCAGYSLLWPGVADVWILPSRHIYRVPISFSKLMRKHLDAIVKKHKLHRMQTASPDDAFHARWMRWLGFDNKEIMRQYTHDKKDYRMWERII